MSAFTRANRAWSSLSPDRQTLRKAQVRANASAGVSAPTKPTASGFNSAETRSASATAVPIDSKNQRLKNRTPIQSSANIDRTPIAIVADSNTPTTKNTSAPSISRILSDNVAANSSNNPATLRSASLPQNLSTSAIEAMRSVEELERGYQFDRAAQQLVRVQLAPLSNVAKYLVTTPVLTNLGALFEAPSLRARPKQESAETVQLRDDILDKVVNNMDALHQLFANVPVTNSPWVVDDAGFVRDGNLMYRVYTVCMRRIRNISIYNQYFGLILTYMWSANAVPATVESFTECFLSATLFFYQLYGRTFVNAINSAPEQTTTWLKRFCYGYVLQQPVLPSYEQVRDVDNMIRSLYLQNPVPAYAINLDTREVRNTVQLLTNATLDAVQTRSDIPLQIKETVAPGQRKNVRGRRTRDTSSNIPTSLEAPISNAAVNAQNDEVQEVRAISSEFDVLVEAMNAHLVAVKPSILNEPVYATQTRRILNVPTTVLDGNYKILTYYPAPTRSEVADAQDALTYFADLLNQLSHTELTQFDHALTHIVYAEPQVLLQEDERATLQQLVADEGIAATGRDADINYVAQTTVH